MSKKTKVMFAFLAVLLCCGITLAVFQQNRVDAATVVKQGSRGEIVRQIQTKLKNWGYYTGGVDGIFGSKTTSAVKSFQRKNKLAVDGIVGKKTANAMGVKLSSSSSGSSQTSGDLYLMARAVYGEARGEPYQGKVAVAAVILNRVRSKDFPNTVSGYERRVHKGLSGRAKRLGSDLWLHLLLQPKNGNKSVDSQQTHCDYYWQTRVLQVR